jgi:tetratricopeptide (TPR) repeat protein
MGRLEAALGELEAVPAPQRSGEILYRIGRIKLMQGDRLGARYALADANLRAPNRPEILGALFELERGAGTLAEVQILERIAQASAARPDDAALARLHGRALGSLGRFDEATKELERALALDPDDVAAYVDLASVLRARGAKSALQYLDEASAARPTSAEPYFVRGLIHEAQEDWKTAIEAYEQALAREPGFSMAKNNLAYALLQSGGAHERALALAQEARRDLPLVPEVADTLGYALLRSGEPAAALPLFRECLGRLEPSDPSVPIVELHLAEAHAARGERAEARRLAQRVISKLPPAVPGKPEPAWMARARALLAELTAP